jgi:hypothetical protein
MTPMPQRPPTVPPPTSGKSKRLDAPMPLSEFAKQSRRRQDHTGHGRRDQLTAGERTRILRMLRDEGGRIADEESQVHIGAAPPVPRGMTNFDFGDDDDIAAPPAPRSEPMQPTMQPTMQHPRAEVEAKPALVVGIAQARNKRNTAGPSLTQPRTNKAPAAPPPVPQAARNRPPTMQPPTAQPRSKPQTMQPPRRPVPAPFTEDPTRAVQGDELAAVRAAPGPGRSLFDEPTRMGDIDMHLLEQTRQEDANAGDLASSNESPKFLDAATELSPQLFSGYGATADELEEATRMASIDSLNRPPRAPPPPARSAPVRTAPRPGGRAPGAGRRQPPPPSTSAKPDERTRAVDIRDAGINDPSINDIDWDID